MMDVLVCEKPGIMAYQKRNMPVMHPGYALLQVKHIGVCGTDLHAYEGTQPYFEYPRILGHELACVVHQVPPDAGFLPGDRVTLIPYFNCGTCIACRQGHSNCCVAIKVFGVHIDGGMQSFISVPVESLIKANDLGFDELALVEPLAIGAHGIRRAAVKAGEFVLVMGAGPIGLGIMEFARIAGAQVIALDINNARLEFCKNNLQVPFTINAATEDVMDRLQQITSGDMPTLIVDATGNKKAINKAFLYLAHGGRYVLVGLQMGNLEVAHPEFHKRETTLMSSRNATRQDFDWVLQCMRNGLVKPTTYITHKVKFEAVASQFEQWLQPEAGVIKAMVIL